MYLIRYIKNDFVLIHDFFCCCFINFHGFSLIQQTYWEPRVSIVLDVKNAAGSYQGHTQLTIHPALQFGDSIASGVESWIISWENSSQD